MVIRTRYSIGDMVWFILNNKIHVAPIGEVSYSTDGNKYSLSYLLKGFMEGLHPIKFRENELFETKEDLIDSL